MRRIKIVLLVMLGILTAFLCGIFIYGMTGHNIYKAFRGGYYDHERDYVGIHLVLEQEVAIDGIDSISVSYSKNSNDVYLYEGQGDMLAIKEYNEVELNENELSTVSVNGSKLEIKGKRRSSRRVGAGFFHFGDGGGYTEVWLPASYKGELTLTTSSGDITSEMDLVLERDLKAASTSGEITMPDVTASNVSLGSTSGNVRIENIETNRNGTAGDINIATTSGDITLKQLSGETNIGSTSGYVNAETITGNAQIATTSGDITVQYIDGNAAVESSSGNAKILEGSGERSISTSSGDITIDGADGLWQIHTTSGEVCVKGQNDSGSIETTSGDVSLEIVELNGTLDINTNSGSVNMKFLQDSAFDFSADTTSGNIDTFFDDDLKFSKKGNSAQGTYGQNSQGNSIRIGTTSGDVRIKR
ncbi:MAG: DUF4097 domain-containing protein [Lachnospiraceae bacterium]|nr:DUF4097 domain-containing protein [Lachnospiraceae bacterium]